jgi:hypothetical protein
MNRILANQSSLVVLGLLWAAGTGCESPSQYVSPRITGRVLDELTGQPIPEVRVQRWYQNYGVGSMDTKKGGKGLEQQPFVLTGRDGTFVLKSERSVAFFRELGWYPVTLSFAHRKYESATFSYAEAPATNLPSGEPLVRTGDTRLKLLDTW